MKKRPSEFAYYFVVGGLATLIDWGLYAVCFMMLKMQYIIALVISMGVAGCFHYVANKRLTFRCDSRALHVQVPVYVTVASAGIGVSAVLLSIQVSGLGINALIARPLTTILMLLPNYFMHKYMTFNRKLFGSER